MNTQLTAVDFDPFAGPALRHLAPTTEPLVEVWTACLLGGDDANRAYNESVSLRLHGTVRPEALARAFDELLRRHEALRSLLSPDGRQVLIFDEVPSPLRVEAVPDAHLTARHDALVAEEARHVFDLRNGPLCRGTLLQGDAGTHYFTLTAHHLVCDGWSAATLLRDLGTLYTAYVQGISPDLPPAPRYSDYAAGERTFAESAAYRRMEAYWLETFRDSVPVLSLPTDFPRPTPRTYASRRADYPLDEALVKALKQTGLRTGSSLVTTLMAAFEVFLRGLTHQDDLVLGVPAAGQSVTGAQGLVGHCVNLLPLRSRMAPGTPFDMYLRQRQEELLDAYEHQQVTFGSLVRRLNLPRDPARIPLAPVVFNVDLGFDDGVSFQGLRHACLSNPRAFENFELSVNLTGSGGSLTVEWSYNTQLFRPETIAAWMREFRALLERVTGTPAAAPYLNGHARAEALPAPPAEPHPAGGAAQTPLHVLLSQTAERYPERPALRFRQETWTFRQYVETANRLAHYLLRQGVGPGTIVGMALDRSAYLPVTLLAILKTGAAYLPIDPDLPEERIGFMLEDAAARLLITSARHLDRLHYGVRTVTLEEALATSAGYPEGAPAVTIDCRQPAYLLFTSGSTGRPKGVLIEHRSIVNLLHSMLAEPGMTPDDVFLSVSTISFDVCCLDMFLPPLAGGTLVIAEATSIRNGQAVLELFAQEGVTMVTATPAMLRLLLASGWAEKYPLRILCGGEPLPKDLAQQLFPRCAELWNMYGPTETTVYSTGKRILPTDEVITIGKAIANTQLYLLDEAGGLVPEGQEGELAIAGEGVGRGYLNRPELTAEKFIPNPFGPPESPRLYRSGDLARRLPNGEILHLGRIDQQVKIRGYRIELGEIEYVLNSHPGISASVVTAQDDRSGTPSLVAYVVPADHPSEDANAVGWQDRWDVIYERGAAAEQGRDVADRDLDFAIARAMSNSETLKQQADEWLRQSIDRLRALRPRRILEVGSGAGQLVFPLAEDAEFFLATDYAQTAIDSLRQKLALDPARWGHVQARQATADDFTGIAAGSLDLVLVHSVAQYFPSAAYLRRVIEGAVAAVRPGGCVFIGDMQGRSTLEMHHAYDQFLRTPPTQTAGTLKSIIARRVQAEDELTADPAFFYHLPALIPGIRGVDIQLRRGELLNETTRHHYDVWLYVGEAPPVRQAEHAHAWVPGQTLADLEAVLRQHAGRVVHLTDLPNHRLGPDHALLQLLPTVGAETPVEQLRAQLAATPPGIDPEALARRAESLGYRPYLRWRADGADGRFEAFLIPASAPAALPPRPAALSSLQAHPDAYARGPVLKTAPTLTREQIQEWKRYARTKLPVYMVPAEFVALAQLPLSPNGKIDRKALVPVRAMPATPEPDAPQHTDPRNEAERLVATLWKEYMGLDRLSIDDNFFELGGHSLMAVQIMNRLEKETGQKLPLASLFEHSTVRKLARLLDIDEPEKNLTWGSLVPIRAKGSKTPLYIVHGGGLNVLVFKPIADYLDPDQPVFGLQAQGLNGSEELLETIEEIAAHYVQAILQQNPHGPYALSGYSFGGLVAYEMARQFQEMGKEVRTLAMFDTYAEQSAYHLSPAQRLYRRLHWVVTKVGFTSWLLLREPARTIRFNSEALQWFFIRLRAKLSPGPSSEKQEARLQADPIRIQGVHNHARHVYRLRPQPVAIDLFRARQRTFYMSDPVYMGWGEFALNGVRTYDIPGEHNHIFSPPNAREFARTLQDVLDKAP
jgi:amino acid adenylation domain-containing protein